MATTLPPHQHQPLGAASSLPDPDDPSVTQHTIYLAPRIQHTVVPQQVEEVRRVVERERHVHHVVMHYQPVVPDGEGGMRPVGEPQPQGREANEGTYTTQNHIHTHVRPPISARPTDQTDATNWTEQNAAYFTAPGTPMPDGQGQHMGGAYGQEQVGEEYDDARTPRAVDPIRSTDYGFSAPPPIAASVNSGPTEHPAHVPRTLNGRGLQDSGGYGGIGNAEYIEAPAQATDVGSAGRVQGGGEGRYGEYGVGEGGYGARQGGEGRNGGRGRELEGAAIGGGGLGAVDGLEHHQHHQYDQASSNLQPALPTSTDQSPPPPAQDGAPLSPSASTRRRLHKSPKDDRRLSGAVPEDAGPPPASANGINRWATPDNAEKGGVKERPTAPKTPFWKRVLIGKEVVTKKGRVEHVPGCFR